MAKHRGLRADPARTVRSAEACRAVRAVVGSEHDDRCDVAQRGDGSVSRFLSGHVTPGRRMACPSGFPLAVVPAKVGRSSLPASSMTDPTASRSTSP
ncbi:hypothetical protein [Parafrankia sp. EUN1f]|uniref:hypothetical protein n=1 Tax=Parafrankia sp. EUN1f TaxID=102897 RepID=UPI00055CDCCA|nr:hypothetical protein [Parafrankia sp. EUN1f]